MFAISLLAAGAVGFIALSYEIVWYRVVSFLTWSAPASFGVLLGAYLLGIAAGSFGSRFFVKDPKAQGKLSSLRGVAAFVFFANAIGFYVVPSIARAAKSASPVLPLLAVTVAAGLLGAVLPLLSHFAIPPDDRAGQRLSYLYVANIGVQFERRLGGQLPYSLVRVAADHQPAGVRRVCANLWPDPLCEPGDPVRIRRVIQRAHKGQGLRFAQLGSSRKTLRFDAV